MERPQKKMKPTQVKIGVLALQGAYIEHINLMAKLENPPIVVQIREKNQIDDPELDGLIIPGGESTTMALVAERDGMLEKLFEWIKRGKPIWGTCAGTIFLSKKASSTKEGGQTLLTAMDITVDRNFFGRQINSFHQKITIPNIAEDVPFNCIFIRAPMITEVGENVKVIATLPKECLPKNGSNLKQGIIAAQQGNLFVTVFHPELTSDTRIHQYFLDNVVNSKKV